MIKVDEDDPIGELLPRFPYRDVSIKRNVDMKEFYDLQSEIGRGKFGTVYRCTEKSTGIGLAAKFVGIARRQDRRNVEREVEIMRSLQHPRLIQLYDAFEFSNVMCVIQELIEGGELFERVIDDSFILTEKTCAVFMRQICEGVEFIHSQHVLHLDLKPENILCLTRTGNRIKIIDFGLARKFEPDKKLQVLFGTPEFVAPEVVNFDQIGFGTDMWSVGVMCYVLLSGLSPFMGETDVETMANVTIAQYDFEDDSFDVISQDAKDFITKLLMKNKEQRLTASECLSHSWLRRRPPPVAPVPVTRPLAIDDQLIDKDNLREFVDRYAEQQNISPTRVIALPVQPPVLTGSDVIVVDRINNTPFISNNHQQHFDTKPAETPSNIQPDVTLKLENSTSFNNVGPTTPPPLTITPNIITQNPDPTSSMFAPNHKTFAPVKPNLTNPINPSSSFNNVPTNTTKPDLVKLSSSSIPDNNKSVNNNFSTVNHLPNNNNNNNVPIRSPPVNTEIMAPKFPTSNTHQPNMKPNNIDQTVNKTSGSNAVIQNDANLNKHSIINSINNSINKNNNNVLKAFSGSDISSTKKSDKPATYSKQFSVPSDLNKANKPVIDGSNCSRKVNNDASFNKPLNKHVPPKIQGIVLGQVDNPQPSSGLQTIPEKKMPKVITHKIFVEGRNNVTTNSINKEPFRRTETIRSPQKPITKSLTSKKLDLQQSPAAHRPIGGFFETERFDRRGSDISCFLHNTENMERINLSDEIKKMSLRLFQMGDDNERGSSSNSNMTSNLNTRNQEEDELLRCRVPMPSFRNDPIGRFLADHGVVSRRPKFRMSHMNRDVPLGSPPPPSNFFYHMSNPTCDTWPDNQTHSAPQSPSISPERDQPTGSLTKEVIMRLFNKPFLNTSPTPFRRHDDVTKEVSAISSIDSLASYFKTNNDPKSNPVSAVGTSK